ncbi:MAG TPA: DegT/DnrJ/EryC1/StrS family aminotransferase [Thermoleophilaceae bacterium]|jgi:dTDP-4-amino-4,6-dideoxygalactose transaminase
MPVPLFAASLERYHDALAERAEAVIRSGRYILGPEVEAFEAEFAAYCGAEHCVGVANGTDALTIALRALGVRQGDEVVMPSLTFYATAEAAVNAGATPVFCDVDPETYCVTPETVAAAVTPRTRAIVPVHLFGNVAPVDELREHGVPVLEDAAQAAGARRDGRPAGSLGDAATVSFFPSKNLGGLGDGGAILTDDEATAARARELRFHGSRDKITFDDVGYNSRLDELQAAALRVLLPELDGWNEARRAVAAAYEREGLGELVRLPVATRGTEHVYHLYVARHEDPDELVAALGEAGVQARGYYRRPVHLQPSMERFGGAALDLPGTDEVARTNVALPMGPDLDESAVGAVVEAVRSAVSSAVG